MMRIVKVTIGWNTGQADLYIMKGSCLPCTCSIWRCETYIERNLIIEDGNYAKQSWKNYIKINCSISGRPLIEMPRMKMGVSNTCYLYVYFEQVVCFCTKTDSSYFAKTYKNSSLNSANYTEGPIFRVNLWKFTSTLKKLLERSSRRSLQITNSRSSNNTAV